MTAAQAHVAAGEWDLSDLYSGQGDPAIEADRRSATQLVEAFVEAYQGRVAELTASDLCRVFEELAAITRASSNHSIGMYEKQP